MKNLKNIFISLLIVMATSQNTYSVQTAQLEGQESFLERYKIISKAKKYIRLQTIIFYGDESGIETAKLLIKKKKEGVDVKVFIDSFFIFLPDGFPSSGKDSIAMYDNMMAAGIPVLGYQCGSSGIQLGKELLNSWSFNFFLNLSKIAKNFLKNRRHEKILTVDGKVAIIGGSNIADEYFQLSSPGKRYWRDLDLLIQSKDQNQKSEVNIIQALNNIFDGNFISYQNTYHKKGRPKCLNPYEVGTPQYENFLIKHTKRYGGTKSYQASIENRHISKKIAQLKNGKIAKQVYHLKMNPVSEIQVIQQRPKLQELYIEEAYLKLIKEAQYEILLANPYFVPSTQIKNALNEAANRGVIIKIIVNDDITNDNPIVTTLARYYYLDLLEQNVNREKKIEIYEWDGIDKNTKKQVYGLFHVKSLIVDRKISLLGSYNLDSLSRNFQSEIAVIIESKEQSNELVHKFIYSYLSFANKISYKKAFAYKNSQKIKLSIAKKIAPLL